MRVRDFVIVFTICITGGEESQVVNKYEMMIALSVADRAAPVVSPIRRMM